MRERVFYSGCQVFYGVRACVSHWAGHDCSTASFDLQDVRGVVEMREITDLPDKKLLRISEAANYFGVHERTIRLWIEHGKLDYEKPAGTVFITRTSIMNFRLLGKRD